MSEHQEEEEYDWVDIDEDAEPVQDANGQVHVESTPQSRKERRKAIREELKRERRRGRKPQKDKLEDDDDKENFEDAKEEDDKEDDDDDVPRCWYCNKPAAGEDGKFKQCARCEQAIYCSAECQALDWENKRNPAHAHNYLCKTQRAIPMLHRTIIGMRNDKPRVDSYWTYWYRASMNNPGIEGLIYVSVRPEYLLGFDDEDWQENKHTATQEQKDRRERLTLETFKEATAEDLLGTTHVSWIDKHDLNNTLLSNIKQEHRDRTEFDLNRVWEHLFEAKRLINSGKGTAVVVVVQVEHTRAWATFMAQGTQISEEEMRNLKDASRPEKK